MTRRLLRSVLAVLVVICASTCGLGASRPMITLTGIVLDARTRLPIDDAEVSIVETHQRSAADSSGFFRIALPGAGRYTLAVRRLGYAGSERTLMVDEAGSVVGGQEEAVVVMMQPVMISTDEVIIRSTRVQSAPPDASPIPFSVITCEEAALRPALTSAEALTTIPGVTLVRDGAWETAVSIRGMSRSNIVMMVDNTRIETANDIAGALSMIDVNELERIELVHSPGSSLWGSGAIGGVVHMMTKQPSFSTTALSRGQVDEQVSSVNGLFSHHLAFDHSSSRFGFRLGLGARNAGATQTPEGAIANSQFRDMNLNAQLAAHIVGSQLLSLSYQRSQAENAGIPGGAAIAAQAQARYTLARRELFSAGYALSDVSRTLTLLTVRASHQVIVRNVEIKQPPSVILTPHAVHTAASAEIESRFAFDPSLLVTAGIDCWQRSLDSRRERLNTMSGETIGERPVPSSAYLSAGSYLHGMWSVMPDRITIDAGARFDVIRVKNDAAYNPEYVVEGPGIPGRIPPSPALLWNARTEWNRSWSASAGLSVALSRAAELSCLAAASFRSPSLEERFQFIDLGSVVRVGDPALKPEESTSFNLGLTLHEERTSVRADLFINRLTDLVTEVPGMFEGRSALVKANIGEALMVGCELGGVQPLSSRLSLHYSLAYVRGEDRRAHASLPQIPPLTGTLSLNVFVPSAGECMLDATGALGQDRVAANEASTPGYGVLACRYSSEPIHIEMGNDAGLQCVVRCGIENMFDHSYRLHVSTLRGLIRQEPGRNVYLAASISF